MAGVHVLRLGGHRHYVAISPLYAKSRWPGAALAWPLVGPIFRPETAVELDRDRALLGVLADKSPSPEGMKLSRFDKVLGP